MRRPEGGLALFRLHKADEDPGLSEILARLLIQVIYRESTGNRVFRFFLSSDIGFSLSAAQNAKAQPPLPASGRDRRKNARLGFQPSPILRAKASERKKRSRYSRGLPWRDCEVTSRVSYASAFERAHAAGIQ